VAEDSLAESTSVGLADDGLIVATVGLEVRGSEGGVFGSRDGEPAACDTLGANVGEPNA
jgi:hypothetical protein